MKKAELFRLYLITDGLQRGGGEEKELLCKLEDALAGGARAVQLREKNLTDKELLLLAKKLRVLTRDYGASLFINDSIDVALAAEADGVHLRASGISVLEARRLLGPDKLIGVSTHNAQQARRAEQGGADFITCGPVFFTPSKAAYGEPLGLEKFNDITGSLDLPVFALGGVKKANIKETLKAGTYGIAMISEIMQAPDITKTTREIISLIR